MRATLAFCLRGDTAKQKIKLTTNLDDVDKLRNMLDSSELFLIVQAAVLNEKKRTKLRTYGKRQQVFGFRMS